MSLKGVAKHTLEIVERGEYTSPSGASISVRNGVDAAIRGTMLYRPEALVALATSGNPSSNAAPPRIEITDETTGTAARRLIETEDLRDVVALNFASAKNPGGGFIGGAKAQEEDLARCSALYACLVTQPDYYANNRASESMLYTDHIIYSPAVPFFRDDLLDLLDRPFSLAIITAPAPNAGEALRRDASVAPAVRSTLHSRAGHVLAVARDRGHRALVLGAWGCGVFRNDPHDVAETFAQWLAHPRFRGAFDHVTFAVYDRSEARTNLRAFEARFENAR